MKAIIVLSTSIALLAGCSNNSKELTNVSQGMNKQQVIQAIGEPARRNDLKIAELWVYPTYNKTLVFRADTVYDIVNSSTASVDSIKNSFKELGKDIKKGAKKIGHELDTVGRKLENKFDKDTNDNNR
jgi:hypothetical protein